MTKFTTEEKMAYVRSFCDEHDFSITSFTNANPNISKSSIYKWLNLYGGDTWLNKKFSNKAFVDISNTVKNPIKSQQHNAIKLDVSGVAVNVGCNYDEALLLKILRTLKKL